MDEIKEDLKELKDNIKYKITKLSDDLEVYKDHLRTLDTNIQNHVVGCGLDAYKAEMRERCERLNDNWQSNKTSIQEQKHDSELALTKLEDDVEVKITAARSLSNKIISSALVIGICLVGVFSSINLNKVSQTEFANHITVSNEALAEQVVMFNKFMDSYSDDRIRRDTKLDSMFERQLDFNQGIIKNTSLLQQQLEVLKREVELGHQTSSLKNKDK